MNKHIIIVLLLEVHIIQLIASANDQFTLRPSSDYNETVLDRRKLYREDESSTAELSPSDINNTNETYSTLSIRPDVSNKNRSSPSSTVSSIVSTSPYSELRNNNSEPQLCRIGGPMKKQLQVANKEYYYTACYFCYIYVAQHRKLYDLVRSSVAGDGFTIYGFKFQKTTVVPFDPQNETTWPEVSASFINALEAKKMADCCREAVDCCDQMTAGPPPIDTLPSCPRTWDGWRCFPRDAQPDSVVKVACPVHAYTGYPECTMYAQKSCGKEGEWYGDPNGEKTDYSGCLMETFHHANYIWEITMHAVSLAALTPTFFILFYYRALHLPRFYMHLNFFIALWFKSFFKILEITLVKMPENLNTSTIMEDNMAGCKVLTTLNKMALVSVWAWMLAESVFLYRLIARALNRNLIVWPYVVAAWGGSAVLVSVWALCRALLEDYQCWLGDYKGDTLQLHLITDVPLLLILLVNIILLVDISRIMYIQLKRRRTEQTSINRRAVKATIFLAPMFGLQYLLTAIAPVGQPCPVFQVYMFIVTAVNGLQGAYVSIFYFYRNNEVKKQLTRSLNVVLSRVPGVGGPATTEASVTEQQTTYSTVNSDTHVEMTPLRTGGGRRS